MPVRKGTLERSLGRKALDGAKYVGKNFWKVLPVGSLINLALNSTIAAKGLNYAQYSKKYSGLRMLAKTLGNCAYAVIPLIPLLNYTQDVKTTGFWNLKQQKEFHKHQKEINNSYNKLFKDAANFEDSLKIYQELDLPTKLEEPSFKDKERIVKSLDSSLVD